MARRVVSLILGLTVIGLVILLYDSSKEAEFEVEGVESGAENPAPVTIVASADGSVQVDDHPVELAELTDEIERLIDAAEEAGLPQPAFVIVAPEEADDLLLVTIMEALAQGGASSVAIGAKPAE